MFSSKFAIRLVPIIIAPIILFFVIKGKHESTPQFAYQRLLTAMENKDLAAIQRLTSPRAFDALRKYFNNRLHQSADDVLISLQKMGRDLADAPHTDWTRQDINHAQVWPHGDGWGAGGAKLFLKKTNEGWIIDEVEVGFG